MNFIKKLFSKKAISKQELVLLNACPNCWGKLGYDDDLSRELSDSGISKNDKRQYKAFIEKFVETHITGINLTKKNTKSHCQSCNKEY